MYSSAELLADEEVRAAVADFLVDRIDANVNREIASRLDKDLRAKARTALAAPGVRAQWADANGEAHAGIVALVGRRSEAPAVLNLHPVLEEIAEALGIGPALAASCPTKFGRLTSPAPRPARVGTDHRAPDFTNFADLADRPGARALRGGDLGRP